MAAKARECIEKDKEIEELLTLFKRQIADLQAKLAEAEKRIAELMEWMYDLSAGDIDHHDVNCNCTMHKARRRIAQIEAEGGNDE